MRFNYNRLINLILILIIIHLLVVIYSNKTSNSLKYISELIYERHELQNDHEDTLLNDVLITIKTSSSNHKTRIKNIVSTWYQFAKKQIYAVTDTFDEETNNLLDGKLVPTECSKNRDGLCCKFGSELNLFFSLKTSYKWFCHVDDDNYINIKNLLRLLAKYNHQEYHYLGKSSWDVPVVRNGPPKFLPERYAKFWFGTFGAGVCLSNATMHKIRNHANAQEYNKGCLNMGLPDDTYLGFLLEWKNKIYFKNITTMNHHLEVDQFKNMQSISEQITFSFGKTYFEYYNPDCKCKEILTIIPQIENLYDEQSDPFRMKTLHCLIYPETNDCKLLLTKSLENFFITNKKLVQVNNKYLKLNETFKNCTI